MTRDPNRPSSPQTLGWPTQLLLLVGLALLAAGVFGVLSRAGVTGSPAPDAPKPAAAPGTFRPTAAQWASLSIEPVQHLTFHASRETDGKIAINDDTTTPVFSPYSGRVTELFVRAGDEVEAGAPLLRVAASEFVQGQNDLLSALQALNTARAQLRLTTQNEERQRALYEANTAGALKDWQQAQTDLEAARSAARTAEIALAAVRNRLHILGKNDAEIAALETTPRMDPEAIVRAPIGGTILQRQVGLGQYINSATNGAANPIFSIGNLSTVWLVANVRELDAPLMRRGEAVEVRVLAYPGRVFRAKLAHVAPSVDPNTRRLLVRAEVENPDGALKPEMFASFRIITGADSLAPAIPEAAVVYEGEAARVWVAGSDKSLAARAIRVGRISDGQVEVLAGLRPGEMVVTSGSLFIDRAAKGD